MPRRSGQFARWLRLCDGTTQELARCVEAILLPPFVEAGFARVEVENRDEARPVSGREIRLERFDGRAFEAVTITFDKYRGARFQIALRKQDEGASDQPGEWAHLIPGGRRYHHVWGKPWWAPRRFWRAAFSARLATRLARLLPQCEAFFATGLRGPNLSRAVRI